MMEYFTLLRFYSLIIHEIKSMHLFTNGTNLSTDFTLQFIYFVIKNVIIIHVFCEIC